MLVLADISMKKERKYNIVQDANKALEVLQSVTEWMEKTNKSSDHWQSQNMNQQFMLQRAAESEFYAVLIGKTPVAAVILQDNQSNQSWESVDKNQTQPALYVHWLCVHPGYRGTGLPKILLDFAAKHAVALGLHLLRLDTNADEPKLMKVYDGLGFNLVSVEQAGAHRTAFYQKILKLN